MRQNRKDYLNLVESTFDLMCTHDLNGVLLTVSRAAARALGYEPTELVKQNLRKLLSPEVRAKLDAYLALIRTEGAASGFMRVQTKSGETRIWRYNNTLRTKGVRVPVVRGVAHDVSELLQTQKALRETAQRLSTAAEIGRMYAWEWNPAKDTVRRSPECSGILGLNSATPWSTAKRYFEMVHPDDRDGLWNIVKSLTPDNPSYRTVYRVFRPDGALLWLEESGRGTFDRSGTMIRLIGMTADITERKRAEAEVEDRLRFETLLADLSSRFVNVSTKKLDAEIQDAQRRVCECLGLEMSTLWELSGSAPGLITLTHLYRALGGPAVPEHVNGQEYFPWCFQQVLAGKVVAVPSLKELPPEAARDREGWRNFGVKSNLTVGLAVGGGPIVGALSFNTMQEEHTWPEQVVKRMQLVAQIISNALARQRSDRALQEREEHFRSLVENATVGIYRTTPGGRILMANPALIRMLGYSDFEGLATRDLQKEGFEPSYPRGEFLQRFEKDGEVIGLEAAWKKRDGRLIWVRESARAIRGQEGQILFFDGIVEDITKRKQAEEALRKSEEKFSKAFHASPVPMTILSLATGNYIEVNKAYEEHTGFRADEVLGHTPEELGVLGISAGAERILQLVISQERLRNLETQYRTKAGELRPVLVSTELIEFADEPCKLLVLEDITDRRRMEQSLRETGAHLLMALEEERRRVARELHDDFSQRLALLAIDMEQLAHRPPAKKGDWSERLQTMRSQTQELTSDVHRLSHQLHPSKLEHLGLVAAVRSYCHELSRQAELTVEFSSANVPEVIPREISICIYRLVQEALHNVVKHSGVKTAAVDLSGGPDEICVIISDPGRGFAIEDLRSAKGLGLISMQERVRNVGGTWTVDTRPFGGTRIIVRIPLPSQQASEDTSPVSVSVGPFESPRSDMSRTRVLLADDHTLLLEAFKSLLEPEFDVVGAVADGRAAIVAAEKLRPEVVVLDIAMPLMNGLDAARQIRAILPNTKVIFLTMNPDPEVALEGMRLGASGYLLKNSAASELREAIRNAVRGLKYVTPSLQQELEELCGTTEPGKRRPA